MKVKLKFFASLKEASKKKEDTFEVEEGTTVRDLRKKAVERYPALADIVGMTMSVVNLEYVERDRVLEDGDEVAFIPPVSGG